MSTSVENKYARKEEIRPETRSMNRSSEENVSSSTSMYFYCLSKLGRLMDHATLNTMLKSIVDNTSKNDSRCR